MSEYLSRAKLKLGPCICDAGLGWTEIHQAHCPQVKAIQMADLIKEYEITCQLWLDSMIDGREDEFELDKRLKQLEEILK